MMLCSNRPEGFGPHSTLSAPLPTTCFTDVILIPLPVWLALALAFISSCIGVATKSGSALRVARGDTRHAHRRAYIATSALFYILIVCNVLMQTLEIVRLCLIHFGVGLLPFAYVGLGLGAAMHWSRGVAGWRGVNAVLWIGGVVMCVVKVAGLAREGVDGRKGSKYPVSDQIIDVGVMAGVYAAVALLEGILGVWRARRGSDESLREQKA